MKDKLNILLGIGVLTYLIVNLKGKLTPKIKSPTGTEMLLDGMAIVIRHLIRLDLAGLAKLL